jgi:hypothetical protein
MNASDLEFLAALEQCRLPPGQFTHRQHVRAAFLYLERLPFGAAIDAMSASLRRYVTALGKADRYHETVTVAFMALVNAHRNPRVAETWESFAAGNPELFVPGLLSRYYSAETLGDARSRSRFVLERRPATGSGEPSCRGGRNPAAHADRHS